MIRLMRRVDSNLHSRQRRSHVHSLPLNENRDRSAISADRARPTSALPAPRAVNGGGKRLVVPQSETNFADTGLSYQFIRDDRGVATLVVESRVSGDYKYERQK
jgi:hypothetical protein